MTAFRVLQDFDAHILARIDAYNIQSYLFTISLGNRYYLFKAIFKLPVVGSLLDRIKKQLL